VIFTNKATDSDGNPTAVTIKIDRAVKDDEEVHIGPGQTKEVEDACGESVMNKSQDTTTTTYSRNSCSATITESGNITFE